MTDSEPKDYSPAAKVAYFKLNNGPSIPQVGLGTWRGKEGQVGQAVRTALRAGYRHIDCAKAYGNQAEVGDAFQTIFKEGKIKREDVWITSKLWNTDHKSEDVIKGCKETISELQCDYLDLYLMHWPAVKGEKMIPIKETWQAMEKLVDEGLCKSIGISNFSVKKTEELLSYARIKPAVNQVELHPYFRNDKLHNFCKQHDVHITAYSPLGSVDSRSAFADPNAVPWLLEDPVVKEIADKHHKGPAQICIRWAIQNGTSVIPKATSEAHIRSNLDVLDWSLSGEEFDRLSGLGHQMRMVDGSDFVLPAGPWPDLMTLWDGELPEENQKAYQMMKDQKAKEGQKQG